MHMGITGPGAGRMQLQAEIVVGWHRGLRLSVSGVPARLL